MNKSGMTEGERKVLLYAREVLNGSNDPRVSERIAKIYRNLLFRSRAHDLDDVQKNIDFLEGLATKSDPGSDSLPDKGDGALVAFYAVLAYDQIAAFSLINRVGEKHLLEALTVSLTSLQNEPVTLYSLWNSVTAKLSDVVLESSSVAWVRLANRYCQAMLPTNPLPAFSIWLQACEWQQRFPSAFAVAILIELAYFIMKPNDQKFQRMNNALWAFVLEQDEARALTNQLGQAVKVSSLLAASEKLKAEISKTELDESVIDEVADKMVTWISPELPSETHWSRFETSVREVLGAKPLAALARIETQLESVLQNWTERYRNEAESSIRFNTEPPPWVDGPLYSADWVEVVGEEEIRNFAWPLALRGRILHGNASMIDRVRFLKPSFYPNLVLLEIQAQLEDGTNAICNAFTSAQRQVAVLLGQAVPIHSLNASGHLQRMGEAGVALEYLRFFSSAVWGTASPFRIVDKIDDIPLTDDADEESLTALSDLLKERTTELKARSDDSWEVRAVVCHRNFLFQCEFRIFTTGMVEMLTDEPLAGFQAIRKLVMKDGFRFYDGVWEDSN